MKQIQLTKGRVALVNDEDYVFLSRWSWYCNNGYGARDERVGGVRKNIKMHRLIVAAPPDMEVDHRDGDTLNNQRDNLRIVTHAQNSKNVKKHRDNIAGLKGIRKVSSRVNKANPYQARIMVDGKTCCLGYFRTAEEAAKAYDRAARELHGQYARINKEP